MTGLQTTYLFEGTQDTFEIRLDDQTPCVVGLKINRQAHVFIDRSTAHRLVAALQHALEQNWVECEYANYVQACGQVGATAMGFDEWIVSKQNG